MSHIPITTSSTGVLYAAAEFIIASKAGIAVSPPSKENLFSPIYFLPRNCSKTTA
ncbi:MAG: hypothetical protein R2772_00245 [Chitinophagales bacterium]